MERQALKCRSMASRWASRWSPCLRYCHSPPHAVRDWRPRLLVRPLSRSTDVTGLSVATLLAQVREKLVGGLCKRVRTVFRPDPGKVQDYHLAAWSVPPTVSNGSGSSQQLGNQQHFSTHCLAA